MKNKKALSMVQMIMGIIVIALLAVVFIQPLFTKKTVAENVEMSEIEKIAGAEEEKCRCQKGILQGKTQICAKSNPNNYNKVELPNICKAWIDCDNTCYKKT
jgi:competence protein ComGC